MKNPFRKRKKTFVDSQTVPMFDEDTSLPTITESVLKAVLQGTNVVDEIKYYIKNGPIFKLGQYYKFAATKHIDGVPKGIRIDIKEKVDFFESWLRTQYAEDIEIIYADVGNIDVLHYAKSILEKDYAYDATENRIISLEAMTTSKVFVENFEIRISSKYMEESDVSELTYLVDKTNTFKSLERFLSFAGINAVVRNYSIIEDNSFMGVTVNYSYSNAAGDREEGNISIPVPITDSEEVEESGFFQAAIRRKSSNKTEYFTYELGNGLYPVLDNLFTTGAGEESNNYPIVMLIENKQVIEKLPKEDRRRKDTFKLLRLLGMDLKGISDELVKNPDADKVQQAALIIGCPLNSEKDLHIQYLFEYFSKYHLLGETKSLNGIYWRTGSYECEMTHQGIKSRTLASIVAKNMKEYAKEIVTRVVTSTYEDHEGMTQTTSTSFKDVVIKKKINNYTYKEIIITNPVMRVKVSENRYALHEADSKHFLLPIEKDLADTFSLNLQKELLIKCLHLQVSILETVTVKWYETAGFARFLKIVGVVLVVVSMGMAAPGAAAAFSAGWLAGAAAVGKIILMTLVFKYAAEYVIEKWGPENAALAMLAVLVVSTFVPGQVNFSNLTLANSYLQLSTNLAQHISTAINTYTEEIVKATHSDIQKFQKEFDELVELEKELFPDNDVSRFFSMIILGERADDFYNRTVHASNPGIQSIEHLTHYVDNALTPPPLQESLMRITV